MANSYKDLDFSVEVKPDKGIHAIMKITIPMMVQAFHSSFIEDTILSDWFKKLDIDRDGRVSYEEFMLWIRVSGKL